VNSFEEVYCVDPANSKSLKNCLEHVDQLDFYTQIYPEEYLTPYIEAITSVSKSIQAPRLIFLPSEEMVRRIIATNIKYAQKDSLEEFLLRFGLLEHMKYHLSKSQYY